MTDQFGDTAPMPFLGIEASKFNRERLNPLAAFGASAYECYDLSATILTVIKQMLVGQRSIKEMGGPIKIAEYSGKSASIGGVFGVLIFIAMISVNLGLMNLMPIPVLDGGHAIFYLYEMLVGRAVPVLVQRSLLNIGVILLLILTGFVIFNDIFNILMR